MSHDHRAHGEGLAISYPSGFIVDWHHHDRDQLAHAISGVMRIETEGFQWVVPPGRALWVPGRREHKIVCSGQVEMRSLYFKQRYVRRDRSFSVVNVSALLRELLQELCRPLAPRKRTLLMNLVRIEVENSPSLPLNLPQARDPRLLAFCRTLTSGSNTEVDQRQAARLLCMSPRSFTRQFIAEVGMSYRAWKLQVRLLNAIDYFWQGNSLGAAARLAGYASQSAFSAAFKTSFGLRPSALLSRA